MLLFLCGVAYLPPAPSSLTPFIAPTPPRLAAKRGERRVEVAVIVRRAFVDDLPSSRCVGGMRRRSIACRVVATDA